jgi:ribonucleoside-diphosphate reductase alpha chain
MFITKRNGLQESYDPSKIVQAMEKAFLSVGQTPEKAALTSLLTDVEARIGGGTVAVEAIQDAVEQALMAGGHYPVARSYILYRENRTKKRAAALEIAAAIQAEGLEACLLRIGKDFQDEAYGLDRLSAKYSSFEKADMGTDRKLAALVKAAVELTTQEAPRWEFIAARLRMFQFERALSGELSRRGIGSFYEKIRYLTDEGLYGPYILEKYSRAEIEAAAAFMDPARNDLFTYAGLDLLLSRYVIRTRKLVPLETPQEMFLGIALHLAMEEKVDRLGWVKKFYDLMSRLQLTMATPTLSNARKPFHQLSSCFIDTVPDSLEGIYHSIDSFAKVSKHGGGMGLYFGKVRATGSTIRGFEGAAGGIIRWIKLVNDTCVAVDQLGMRQGAVAVYLDAWHRDLPEFLQMRTNNGDDRSKAHDVFPGICYPDLFWKMVRQDMNQSWYLMCPHDILTVKGYSLEDYYGDEWEARYRDCIADDRIKKREIPLKELVRLILKSAVETGTPFAFNRDIVNRLNPNPHAGMIYCSNLCTEIAQNMSGVDLVSREIVNEDGDTLVVTTTRPGDFVVCNLASLSLGVLPVEDDEAMGEVISTAVRALDNVIDLNFYPVAYAGITNRRYRSIGLGVHGYHHMLAKRGIAWESERHLAFADEVFERINYWAIAASNALAREKGAYSLFEGSDWQTGAYFEKRGYTTERWRALAAKVSEGGLRNAYLVAVAPTSSTSILAGTTAGVDPVMSRYYLEEKKGAILPRVAPELSMATHWYYKSAHTVDQTWSVRAAGVRQRHIDQSQSVNLYVTNEYTMRQVLELYLLAHASGVKTVYYVRSKALEVEACDSCAS